MITRTELLMYVHNLAYTLLDIQDDELKLLFKAQNFVCFSHGGKSLIYMVRLFMS